MTAAAQNISGVAERYASSLFELAVETKSVSEVSETLTKFDELVTKNKDLSRLIKSPVFSSEDQLKVIQAILNKSGASGLAANLLQLLARNKRLYTLPQVVRSYKNLLALHNGEVKADVRVAQELTAAQKKELTATLEEATGKKIALHLTVDAALLGGMVVKIGSRQVDTSLKTKLSTLKLSLKEVG